MQQGEIVSKLFFISFTFILQVNAVQIQERIATVLQKQQSECEQGEIGTTVT